MKSGTKVLPGTYLVASGGKISVPIDVTDTKSGMASCTYAAEESTTGTCGTVKLGGGNWNLTITATDLADNVNASTTGPYQVLEYQGLDAPYTGKRRILAPANSTAQVAFQMTGGQPDTTGSLCLGKTCTAFAWNSSTNRYEVDLPTTDLKVGRTLPLSLKVPGASPDTLTVGSLRGS